MFAMASPSWLDAATSRRDPLGEGSRVRAARSVALTRLPLEAVVLAYAIEDAARLDGAARGSKAPRGDAVIAANRTLANLHGVLVPLLSCRCA